MDNTRGKRAAVDNPRNPPVPHRPQQREVLLPAYLAPPGAQQGTARRASMKQRSSALRGTTGHSPTSDHCAREPDAAKGLVNGSQAATFRSAALSVEDGQSLRLTQPHDRAAQRRCRMSDPKRVARVSQIARCIRASRNRTIGLNAVTDPFPAVPCRSPIPRSLNLNASIHICAADRDTSSPSDRVWA